MNPSIAFIASPELLPGAASPRMLMDGKPLNRSSFGDPDVQWPEAKEEKGTILPAVFRTWSRSRSVGSMR